MILSKYVAADASGISNLRNTGKSVTTELSDTHYYTHYIDINICLQAMTWIHLETLIVTHYVLLLQNVSLNPSA